ncbi:MAG: ABC transporter permease [Actinomycetota bacterium]
MTSGSQTATGAWSQSSARRTFLAPGTGAAISGIVIGLLVLSALTANLIRPGNHLVTDLSQVLQAPSLAHPFGTDEVGRDLLAMTLRGLRISFAISTLAALLALVMGGAVGVIAGLAGRRVDSIIMRGVDFFSSQSHLLFGILIAVLLRPLTGGAGAVLFAVGLTHWMMLARLIRAEALSLKQRQFVAAAINAGANRRQLVRRHILPHLAPVAGLGFVLMLPHAIFHESALSFLGVGLPNHQPSLGNLISSGQRTLLAGAWWVVAVPGLLIVAATVSVGTVAEWWRDRAQPRWRQELEL